MPATETLGGVSTVRQEQINRLMPTRPADLIYGMPGVYVQERPDDPGTAINIRGLQDFGRVNVVVDGARQNFQRTGHNANGIFYLEPELISSLDVIRGPVANVFGSGAIGGVASFRTKDVDDVLKAGERWGVLTHDQGITNGLGGVATAFAAARLTPDAEIFTGGTYRSHKTYQDGDGNTVPNTGYNVQTGVVKGTFRPALGHQVKVGYIDYDSVYVTGQPFPPGTPPPSAPIYSTGARNELATARWIYSRPDDRLFDFDANVYRNRTATDQTKIAGTGDPSSGFIGALRASIPVQCNMPSISAATASTIRSARTDSARYSRRPASEPSRAVSRSSRRIGPTWWRPSLPLATTSTGCRAAASEPKVTGCRRNTPSA
jgi:hemoglobin/transferrin/lactoferrin receptor protein